jgi:dihydroorotase
MSSSSRVALPAPDDFHHHFRDGEALKLTVPHAARLFRRAIAMPNLRPPVTTTRMALEYRERILGCLPKGSYFEPLMTLYLTDNTTAEEIRLAKESGHVYAVKLYPAGATTNSDSGVTDVTKVAHVLEALADVGMPLLVHGEVTGRDVDVFDKEASFIETVLKGLVASHPRLKIVMEHITTKEAVEFVTGCGPLVAATITPQHLLMNRNAIFDGGIRPHNYCLPVLKREEHRRALLAAIASGSSKFILGTDSAPHAVETKERSCGCAGLFTGHAALELYCEAFDEAGALDKLPAFASKNGAEFYGLPLNSGDITVQKKAWKVPDSYNFGDSVVVPMRAGESIAWQAVGEGLSPPGA